MLICQQVKKCHTRLLNCTFGEKLSDLMDKKLSSINCQQILDQDNEQVLKKQGVLQRSKSKELNWQIAHFPKIKSAELVRSSVGPVGGCRGQETTLLEKRRHQNCNCKLTAANKRLVQMSGPALWVSVPTTRDVELFGRSRFQEPEYQLPDSRFQESREKEAVRSQHHPSASFFLLPFHTFKKNMLNFKIIVL